MSTATSPTALIGPAAQVALIVAGYLRPVATAKLIGLVLTAGGTYGWLQPIPSTRIFGLPPSPSPPPNPTTLFPGIGGRNLAAGLTALTLSYLADTSAGKETQRAYRKALGALILFWTLAGYSDSYILLTTPGSDNLATHVINIGILTMTGARLLLGDDAGKGAAKAE